MNFNYQIQPENHLEKFRELLKECEHGFEREMLRVDSSGHISMSPHPESLGSPLFHPHISLDFSEAQLELVSSHGDSFHESIKNLKDAHRYVAKNLPQGEMLWPLSMPSDLPKDSKIPLGFFGASHEGKEKALYRMGLGYRYGRKMQAISGVHHNFSFSKSFWEFLYKTFGTGDKEEWKQEKYMGLVRNYLRHGWLATYLFGASPFADQSYFTKVPAWLKPWEKRSFYGEHATSLRMSKWGYYSKVQSQVAISYNSLPAFINGMQKALTRSHPSFSKIESLKKGPYKKQLNDYILQKEAEYYGRIRPKPKFDAQLGMMDTLSLSGIEYIEVRSLDINPFSPIGIEEDSIYFHWMFLFMSLLLKSPKIDHNEQLEICKNQTRVAMYGRKEDLLLKRKGEFVSLKEYAESLLSSMQDVITYFPISTQKKMKKYLKTYISAVNDSSQTLSGKLSDAVFSSKKEFLSWGIDKATEYFHELKTSKLQKISEWNESVRLSLKKNAEREVNDDYYLKSYEDLEISTQMVLKEAISQGIQITEIDRKKNIYRLEKGSISELIYKATFTSKDPLISYFLMENKEISKKLLREQGILVPEGIAVDTMEKAISYYNENACTPFIVKPAESNFGIGITYVPAGDKKIFIKAIKKAFEYGEELLIEHFFQGEEYRFLVIDGKCRAVCLREKAHVIGDGISTISTLVDLKNQDPRNYKMRYPIKKGKEEKENLKLQNLSFTSVLKKGERANLRYNSNVTTGGDAVDITDDVHPFYKKIAEKASKSTGAVFCGVDIMSKDLTSLNKKAYVVIEINFNPALYLHRYPVVGPQRYVEKYVLEALGF